MGTSNSKRNVFIVWIDKKVNNNENKDYQKDFKKCDDFQFYCFDNVEEGIKCLLDIKFKKTIIITSGSLYQHFYKKFQGIINQITIIPKIFIFTSNANNFISMYKDSLPINDPFYNSGGIFDDIKPLKESILSSITLNDKNNEIINEDENIYLREERFSFELITDKNQLILPLYYSQNLKTISNEEIKNFNKKIMDGNHNNSTIKNLLSLLGDEENVPMSIVVKYWLRAYSSDTNYRDYINKELLNKNYKDYLPMIVKLYEEVDGGNIPVENSQLYKGIIASKSYIQPLLDNKKKKGLPRGFLYGGTFFSFYKEKSLALKIKEKNESLINEDFVFILLILEETNNLNIKNNANIKDIYSDKETVFFPFSCFEIKTTEEKNKNEYIFYLCHLDKNKRLFNNGEEHNFKDAIKTEFSELIFDSGIIDTNKIITPDWFKSIPNTESNTNNNSINLIPNRFNLNESNYTARMSANINVYNSGSTEFMSCMDNTYNQNNIYDTFPGFSVLQSIEDSDLLSKVRTICINTIIQINNNYYNNAVFNLRDLIQCQLFILMF